MRCWIVIVVLSLSALAHGQSGTTTVTAQVQDINGDIYAGCQWSTTFVGQNTTPGAGPYAPAAYLVGQQGHCDSFGNFSANLADNVNTVTPTPSQWQFNICSATGYVGGPYCSNSILITITGATQNLTSTIRAAMPILPAVLGTNLAPGSPVGAVQIKSGGGSFAGGASPIYASQSVGTDCGQKINNADSFLGATYGEIWVDQNCNAGGWTTAVVLSTHHVLRFVQGGTYTLSNGITLPANANIFGSTGAMAVNTTPSVLLKMANFVNLSSIINVTGSFASVKDIAIDGNKSNNASGGSGIIIGSTVSRFNADNVTVGNFATNGVLCNACASPKFTKLMTYQNTADGLFCTGTASGGGDGFVTDSEFENNLSSGIELGSCPAWRIQHSDFGQNSLSINGSCGISVYGTAAAPSNSEIIIGNQFGGDSRNDICITGYNGGETSIGNTIVGNIFIGGTRLLANTYGDVVLMDGGVSVVTGNVFEASGGNSDFAAVSISESSHGQGVRVADNVYVDSTSNGGSPAFQSGRVVDSTATNGVTCSNILANVIAISSGWGTSASVGSPSGYIPSCVFAITTGSATFSASPTVTFTYPGSLMVALNEAPACTLSVIGITGSGGAIQFNPTSVSLTATTWTAQTSTGAAFTPAGTETYNMVLGCQP